MNENNIKTLRLHLNETQDQFAHKIGLTRSRISYYESLPPERVAKSIPKTVIHSICYVYDVQKNWLLYNEGPMYDTNVSDTTLQRLIEAYDLTDLDKELLQLYLSLSKDERNTLRNIVKKIQSL